MNCLAQKLLENERAMIKLVSNYLGKIEVLIRLFTNSLSLSVASHSLSVSFSGLFDSIRTRYSI